MTGIPHPVLRCADTLASTLKDTTDVAVEFMSASEKRAALLRVVEIGSQLESLRLRLIAASGDVAAIEGQRDVATWLSAHTRTDRRDNSRAERLGRALDRRWPQVARALAEARLNPAQAEVIVAGLDQLPREIPADICEKAEAQLVVDAERWGPRELRILARRILDVVAPELGEDLERKLVDAEEANARRTTSPVTQRHNDGTTDIRIKVPDHVADRLLTYLHAFTSPRHLSAHGRRRDLDEPHPRRLGAAFCSFLESVDPKRLPLHGGDATTVMVTIDLAALRDGLGTAIVGADTVISVGEARRLACNASIIPVVLGGKSEILDLGRTARFYGPPQRKAMKVRDKSCRAFGCDVPADWCEAHHFAEPWSRGGKTNLADGKLFCPFHHQRAHDSAYLHITLPDGTVRFHRRR